MPSRSGRWAGPAIPAWRRRGPRQPAPTFTSLASMRLSLPELTFWRRGELQQNPSCLHLQTRVMPACCCFKFYSVVVLPRSRAACAAPCDSLAGTAFLLMLFAAATSCQVSPKGKAFFFN